MQVGPQLHLAYCTNIHRGGDWPETWDSLKRYTLEVRRRVAPDRPYAIGLRLGADAARQLAEPAALDAFRRWLDQERCYVFTINGFPYSRFHGTRVKEQVYAPDWTTPERLEYTCLLFDLLAQLVPEGVSGSVSTVPCSFKSFITQPEQEQAMRTRLWQCVEHVAALSERTGKDLHLGLEPEPLCYLETTEETARFFERVRKDRPNDPRLERHLGINYDTCHLAVEYEDAKIALDRLQQARVRLSKVHLSSALTVRPNRQTCEALRQFADDVYLHQVIERKPDGTLHRYTDLPEAIKAFEARQAQHLEHPEPVEWRIHFHIPLHSPPTALFENTSDHLLATLDWLAAHPDSCAHLEMETYTWEVMPQELKKRNVVDQLVGEYEWTLNQLRARGLMTSGQ